MVSKRTVALFLALLAGNVRGASAEPPKVVAWPGVQVWRQPQGLPQNSVLSLLQARDGYLWIGTRGGVSRFDGVHFTTFDDRNKSQLKENEIWSLAEGDDGSVWIATYGGGVSRYRNGQFKVYTTTEGLASNFATVVRRGSDGSVWIGTDGGLSHFKNERFTNYAVKDGLTNDLIRGLYLDHDGTIWIGQTRGGVNRFKDGRIVSGLGDPTPGADIVAFYRDRHQILWMASSDGLYRLADGRLVRFTVDDGLPSNKIRFFAEGPDGALWIGTANGLASYDKGSFTSYDFGSDWASPDFAAFVRDREGSLWLGSRNLGLAHLWRGIFKSYSTRDGLSDPYVASVIEDKTGAVWMGTIRGLNVLKDGQIVALDARSGLPERLVSSVAEDRAGHIWAATEVGLFRSSAPSPCQDAQCDPRFTELTDVEARGLYLRVVYEDRAGTVWAGGNEGLLAYRDNRLTRYTVNDGLPNNAVRAIQEDRDGGLWIGTRGGGISRLKDGRFTNLAEKDGLVNDSVQGLFIDRDDTLWVATRQGMSRLKDGRFTTYNINDGLYSSFIYGIVEDDAGNLWMTCAQGIFRVSKQQLNDFADGRIATVTSIPYGIEHGLSSTVGTVGHQPGAFKARDGSLWFPMAAGVNMVTPKDLSTNTLPPPVHIEDVAIDGQVFQLHQRVETPPGRGDLVFRYTGVSLLAPEKVRFRYKLEGYDRDWIEAGDRRAAYYNNIPPGDYTFLVKAANNDGVWNEAGARYAISLPPHFYQTTWFFGLGVFAASISIAGGYRLRVRAMKARQQELAQLVDQRTAELQSQRSFLRKIIDLNPSFIFAKDTSGRYTLVNQALARAYGTTVDGLLGRTDAELCAKKEDAERFTERDRQVITSHTEAFIPEEEFTDKTGTIRWLQTTKIPFISLDGLTEQVLGVATDITLQKQAAIELQKAKEAAEASTEAKSAFLANMSHEIRTPMNGVLGMTELVLGTDLQPLQREYLEMAKSSAGSLLTIINDVLDFSKIEAGQLTLELREFRLRDTVEMMVKSLRLRASQKGLALRSEVAPDVPDSIVADSHRLGQVVTNLVGNALKFTHEGGVTLRVSLAGPVARDARELVLHIEVEDSGIGISADVQAHIFEPFHQADGSTTRQYGGTGLGLSISTRLVETMGGRLWLESEEGRGSTFHATLRAGIGTAVRPPESRPKPIPVAVAPLRILLAEDNRVNQRVAVAVLELEGHHVTVAGNGEIAVAAAKASSFDVILMDVQMPVMNGFDATHAIRVHEANKGIHIAIIAMTAHAMQGDRERCLAAGMDEYLSKPLSREALRIALSRVAAEAAPLVTS